MSAGEEEMNRAVTHVPPGEGEKSLRVFGEMMTYKVTSDQTGGAYSLFEVETPPGGGPPLHVQHREDEAFWVLEGEYEFLGREQTLRAVAGSLVYVPKGTLHAHVNRGEGPARMLVSQTPGGSHERFFEEVEEADGAGIPELAADYGIEIALPKGGERSEEEPG
ncbi:MAG: cupin domain-containing protein [Actinomycetota bacterium]|nr:cupin domain-containing protein [Actinomycetota bacterium]